MPQPVITTDLDGIIDNCNKAAEKFLSYSKPNLINQSIHDFLLPKHCQEKPENLIHALPNNEIVSKQFQLKKSNGEVVLVIVSLSNIISDSNQVTGLIFTITDIVSKSSRFHQLEIINQLLATLGDDYRANINCITALCGELLGASSALYNRLENNLLCSFGKWNTPVGYKTEVDPVGHICFDVVNIAQNEAFYVKDLDKTIYAETDPNVRLFGLKTYLGQVVRCNGQAVGSLCVVFQHDYEYTETDRYLLRLLALALEGEETRESLRKSENHYRELFNFAVEGILTGSAEGIITAANHSIFTITGFASEELVGHHISKVLFTKECLKKQPFRFDLLQLNQTVVTYREIQCKNNKLITVEMHSKLMPDKTYQAVLFDVTSRLNDEQKLQLSESTYKGIIDSVNDAVYILDKDGRFLDVNGGAETMYGYEKEFFLHKTPEFLSAPGLNNMEEVAGFIQEAYDGKPMRFEFWGLRKDGTTFPKEVKLAPGLWFGQKIVIAIGRDIIERKHFIETLKESEEKYRLLVQYSSDPVFSFNTDFTYKYVNDAFAKQFGRTSEDIIGKSPSYLFPPDEAERRVRAVNQVFTTGKKNEIDVSFTNTFGEVKYFLTMLDPIMDSGGNVLWVSCLSKDITERKMYEQELKWKNEQLKASNTEKDKFFSIIAHDLRGPMNGFLGLTSIMAEDIESLSQSELKEIATTMKTSAVNVYNLIENLLEWSRMQSDKVNFDPQPLVLKPSVVKSIELLQETASKKEVSLLFNIPDYTVVYADTHMLETIIRNLVSNAIKFSSKDGLVEISSTKTENKLVRIEVKDNGIGMPAYLQEKLFKLTENTSRPGTNGEPSTGLGLILCKEFVEKQGGKIWVESTEGVGTSFIFTLPQP
jgi:PAS domain S-box-containing protein